MDLDAEEVVFAVKIIGLDTEVFAKKIMVALVFGINSGGIYMAMVSMNQDTTMLFQIVVLASEIRYLGTVVFPLVPRLIDIITQEQYP